MGLSGPLIVFPLVALVLSILLGGAGGLTYTGPATSPFCVGANPALQCVSSPAGVTYTCTGGGTGGSCTLPYSCPSSSPPPTYCSPAGLWELPTGQSILVTNAAASNLGPPAVNTGAITFGGIGPTGFIILISVTAAVVVLGALNFLGSGLNSEGIHIAFLTAILLGFWAILSALEGVLTSDPNSFFLQLDGVVAGLGTTTYIFLTLLFTLGVVGTVSRGGSGGGGV